MAVNIQRSATQLSGLQGLDNSGFIQQLAASAIDQAHALLHLANGIGIDHSLGLRGETDMQRDVVGLNEDLIERSQSDVQLLRQTGRHIRIVANDFHAEGDGTTRDFDSDTAQADDAQGLATKLGALQRLLFPFAGMHG